MLALPSAVAVFLCLFRYPFDLCIMQVPEDYIQQCCVYLQAYKDKILSSHFDVICNFIRNQLARSKVQIVNSRHGDHYTDCIWADSDADHGPDNCICNHTLNDFKKIKDIMREYVNGDHEINSYTVLV